MKKDHLENDNPTHQVIPMYVTPNQREIALQDLADFVGAFDQNEVEERITQSIDTCLTADSYYFEKPIQRENLLYTMRNIAKVVRALYILFERKAA